MPLLPASPSARGGRRCAWSDEEAGAQGSVRCSAVTFVEDAGNGGGWCRGGARACACGAASALAAAYSIGNTIDAFGSPIVKPSWLSTTGAAASRGTSLCAVRDNHVPIARSTGSHCGGHARGCSTSASLLATLGLVMCGMKAVKKAAATPMRKSAWKREACPFAYMHMLHAHAHVTCTCTCTCVCACTCC